MTDLFPYDIKSLIASFLRGRQLKRLVLVNHAWKAASEPYLLSRLEVPPGNYHMIDGQEEAASWAGLRQLLESQPARVSCIRKMTVFTIPRAVKDTIAILRMISPYVVSWRDFSGCMDHPMDTHCMVATISHLSLAMLPLPALENLTIHLDGTWFQTLPGVLRMTPNLKSLYVYGCMIDFIPTIDSDLWPRLDNLDTLSVKTSLQGLESRFIRTILSRCNNIKRFDLKLSPLKDDDEAALVAHLLPILASPNIEFSTVHFDISWEDGSAPDWHSQLFCYGYPDGLFFDDGYPGLKKFSCIHHHITLWIAPWTCGLETFCIITRNDPDEPPSASDEVEDEGDYSNVGFLPTRTTTGSLSSELLQLMECLPSLTLFEAGYIRGEMPFPLPQSVEGLQSFHIQTFVKGEKTLVHCWTGAQCNLFKLGRHDPSYRRWGKTWVGEPCLSKDGSIEHGYDFSPYDEPELVDTTGSGVTGTTGVPGPYEFTYYQVSGENYGRGWHLPFVLLDYVYSQTRYERMPSRGRRGLELPAHVWQVLDDWYEGVQSLLIDSPKTKARASTALPKVGAQLIDSAGSGYIPPTASANPRSEEQDA